MKLNPNFRANMGPIKPNNVNSEDMEAAKQEGKSQLESQFPQTVNDPRGCSTRYVHVEINGNTYTVFGKPTYEHNMSTGTYTLKSVEYTVEKGSLEMASDYQNNIVEHMPVTEGTKIEDLQSQYSQIIKDIEAKENQLKNLLNKISGNGDQFKSLGWVGVDPKDPDALEKLAKTIEQAQEYLQEISTKVREKSEEYMQKREKVFQLQSKAKELDTQLKEKMQLYNDLCKNYGIENDINLPAFASGKEDLDSLINWYNDYINFQKENIAKVNEAIDNLQSQNKTEDDTQPGPPLDRTIIESLKNQRKFFINK